MLKDKNIEKEKREAQVEKFNSLKNEGRIVFTTFHQSMSYEDFIEGIKPETFEDQINILIEDKKFNEGLEILIDNIPEESENKQSIIEQFYLDCAFICLRDRPKEYDYDLSLKYLNLTNYNPFEIIYMFFDCLNIDIIHIDKKADIVEHKNENQLLNFAI